jgi:N-acetyl-gamma-glutamylphosphate reductase
VRNIYEHFYFPASRKLTLSNHGQSLLNNSLPDNGWKADSPFIRLVEGSPDINWVKTTNFCDISVHSNGKQIVVFSAIDNLVKGAAGQAVQNMNLMFGLDETCGLKLPGTNP